MSGANARQDFVFLNVKVGFTALNRPFAGKYGESYSVSLIIDKATASKETLEVLGKVNKLLTKGGPVDIKDETGLNSTGKFRLSFSSKDPIPVADGQGNIIPHDKLPNIGADTIVNVKFTVARGNYGVHKYIQGVQIVELVEFKKGASTAPTFGKVSDFKFDDTSNGDVKPDFDSVFN